jgi:hypothetical protein
MQFSTLRFLPRGFPISPSDFLSYEMMVVPVEDELCIVLKGGITTLGTPPQLTALFNYVANLVCVEARYLRGIRQKLRFFQLRYEQCPTGTFTARVQEVLLSGEFGMYQGATWAAVDSHTGKHIGAALARLQDDQVMRGAVLG